MMGRKEDIHDLVELLSDDDYSTVINFLHYLVDRSKSDLVFDARKSRRIKVSVSEKPKIDSEKRLNAMLESIKQSMDEYNSEPDYFLIELKRKLNRIWR